jgi:hypothetical protein
MQCLPRRKGSIDFFAVLAPVSNLRGFRLEPGAELFLG